MTNEALSIIFSSLQFKIIAAFIVGGIIGLERQFTKGKEATGADTPGVRTFGLISLFGSAATIVELDFHIKYMILISFLAILLWTLAFLIYRIHAKNDMPETTAIAVFLAFILGILVGLGFFYWALIISVFITAILSSKHAVMNLLSSLEYKELTSALTIGILALIILPIIPSIKILGVLDLQMYFIFLIFVLMIQFAGYVTIKYLGMKKGFIFFASIGSLVHSEATTVEVVRIYHKLRTPEALTITITAIITVIITLLLRTILYLVVLALSIPQIIILYTLTIIPSLILGLFILVFRFKEYEIQTQEKIEIIKNPLSFKEASKFSFILFLISLVVIFITYQDIGYSLIIAFISGLYSVSAVELAVISLLLANKISISDALLMLNVALIAGVLNKILYVKYGGGSKELIKLVTIYVVLFSFAIGLGYILTLELIPMHL